MAWQKQTWRGGLLLAVVSLGVTGIVWAAPMTSSNYQVDETFFGSGGLLDASSLNYSAKQSAGELTVGNTGSANYQAQAGFNSDRSPYLEFIVAAQSIDLGTLRPNIPVTANAYFSVRSYLSSGYVVQTASDPPTNNSYTLQSMATAAAPDSTREQFGINLVANSLPTSFGANPSQLPDATFGFGQASAGYNTTNQFKYVKGDTVAFSTTSTGETDFTISYLFNITNVTPGGAYQFNHVLVATATF